MTVNTITFCRFAFLREWYNVFNKTDVANGAVNLANSIYVAVPSTKDSSIDVYRLPTESVISTIRPPQVASSQNPMANVTGVGMVMAIGILYATPWRLTLIAGYESGHVCVQAFNPQSRTWSPIYLSQPHSQPILSLCVTPKSGFFYTSAADDIIAQHAISTSPFNLTAAGALELALSTPAQITHTKHSGQQSLTIRDDEKVLASAGWDASARVYSVKTLQELAVLKWHKEGCYAVAFAATEIDTPLPAGVETQMRGNDDLAAEPKAMPIENLSNKINITCTGKGKEPASGVVTNASRERERGITSARARREAKAQSTHWVAAGSKDGKVSLWDIY